MPGANFRQKMREPGVLKQSAKLLGAQSKVKRKVYSSWPAFVQRTLWHPTSPGFERSWRSLPVEERLQVAERIKGEGNELYRTHQYEDAAEKYSQAAGLFHYVQRTGTSPHAQIDDAYLSLVTEAGSASLEGSEAAIRALRSTCYSNIAQCLLRQASPDGPGALKACDAALALQPLNAKTLYRRALARELLGDQPSLEAALQDLTEAEAFGGA
eukprot:CAMPEP_0179110246 /NCGR_PEP_ID=MMETSP0796-20121207/51444_1 /TAXON_ID=73915 /ORGANISM="Pyrodinium bahamense, Strain pbaha01" /LENGTH=212 /DNA_ID=CAMNT_0020808377 /DNA_START=75 /DNA_END=710 /DNA_ORIENTATION=+